MLQKALTVTETEQGHEREILQERLESMDNLISDNKAQLDRAINLCLTGKVAQERLQEKISGLEMAIQSLDKERNLLVKQLARRELSKEQAQQIIDKFAKKVDKGLFYTEANFDTCRQLIEILNLEGTLAIEEGQKVVYIRCIFGDIVLPVLNVDWQAVNTTSRNNSHNRETLGSEHNREKIRFTLTARFVLDFTQLQSVQMQVIL